MTRRSCARLVVSAALVLAASLSGRAQAPSGQSILIFAAASLQTVLDGLAPAIEKATGVTVRASYAASSALARQIENGAPADLFISADLDWMDYLAGKALIQPATRVNLLGNQLVLIRRADAPLSLRIAPGFPLAAALGRERLAIADPVAVPAGKYAQAALTSLGVWASVAGKLAPAENVRAALVLVSRGEVPLGIVYRTDALADRTVAIVDTFPASSHPRIVYPSALTVNGSSAATKVLAFLRGTDATAQFVRAGFIAGVP